MSRCGTAEPHCSGVASAVSAGNPDSGNLWSTHRISCVPARESNILYNLHIHKHIKLQSTLHRCRHLPKCSRTARLTWKLNKQETSKQNTTLKNDLSKCTTAQGGAAWAHIARRLHQWCNQWSNPWCRPVLLEVAASPVQPRPPGTPTSGPVEPVVCGGKCIIVRGGAAWAHRARRSNQWCNQWSDQWGNPWCRAKQRCYQQLGIPPLALMQP